MAIILKQSGSDVGIYIDKKLATVYRNQDVEFVLNWIKNNWTNTKVTVI